MPESLEEKSGLEVVVMNKELICPYQPICQLFRGRGYEEHCYELKGRFYYKCETFELLGNAHLEKTNK